jgi:DNA-binding NtrC family response regulator
MKTQVVVLDADDEQRKCLCQFLEAKEYGATIIETLADMDDHFEKHAAQTAIFNLDTTGLNSKGLRKVKSKMPQMSIIALSSRKYHPELEEAFREDISVCLGIPIDFDELSYWLEAFCKKYENEDG